MSGLGPPEEHSLRRSCGPVRPVEGSRSVDSPIKVNAASAEVTPVTPSVDCSSCGAAMRQDAQWCTQCFATVDHGFDPLTAPLGDLLNQGPVSGAPAALPAPSVVQTPAAPQTPGATVATVAPSDDSHRPRHAKHARPATDSLIEPLPDSLNDALTDPSATPASTPAAPDPRLAGADVDLMLTLLAAEHRSNEQASALARHLGDRGTRAIVTAAGIGIFAVAGFVAMAILGMLTH